MSNVAKAGLNFLQRDLSGVAAFKSGQGRTDSRRAAPYYYHVIDGSTAGQD